MLRLRTAVVAGLTALALCAVGVPAASAANGTSHPPSVKSLPALKTIAIKGVAKNGKHFKGTYAIQRFIHKNGKAYAYGTLKGKLKGRHVTRYGVLIPARLTDSATGAQLPTTCTVLHLVLGPINLNLLGLHVTLGGGTNADQPIVLDITAQRGGGLLGDLLCGLTDSLGGQLSTLNQNLAQLTAALNSLVGLLGAL